MAKISEEHYQEFLRICEKDGIKFKDEAEARDSADRLVQLAELLYDQAVIDLKRKKRLETEPKGFHLEYGKYYSCCVCHGSIEGEGTWYDQLGIKCLNCQKAYNDGILPEVVFKDRDSWVADWKIKNDYKLHPATLRKLIRDGKLKPRIVKNLNGTDHYYVFLLSENSEQLSKLAIS